MLFAAAFYFWRLGDQWAAKGKAEGRRQNAESGITQHATRSTLHAPHSPPLPLLSQGGNLNSPPAPDSLKNHASRITNHFSLCLSNTTTPLSQLIRSDRALLLENALLDTTRPGPAIPDHLADYRSYVEAQQAAADLYRQPAAWARMAIHNVAHMGRFSSDRSVREYAAKVWELQPVPVQMNIS